MSTDIDELKKAAQQRIDGPIPELHRVLVPRERGRLEECFRAAANPQAIIALIAEVEELRRDRERLDALQVAGFEVARIGRSAVVDDPYIVVSIRDVRLHQETPVKYGGMRGLADAIIAAREDGDAR